MERFTYTTVEGVRIFTDRETGEKFVDGKKGRTASAFADPHQISQSSIGVSPQVGLTEVRTVDILDGRYQQA